MLCDLKFKFGVSVAVCVLCVGILTLIKMWCIDVDQCPIDQFWFKYGRAQYFYVVVGFCVGLTGYLNLLHWFLPVFVSV